MVLDKRRGWADWIVGPLAHRLRHVDPNTITWTALPVAVASGVLYYLSQPDTTAYAPILLFAALVLVGVTAYLDLLDGRVASMFGKQSRKGDYLDQLFGYFLLERLCRRYSHRAPDERRRVARRYARLFRDVCHEAPVSAP
jgi:hypothetical protein